MLADTVELSLELSFLKVLAAGDEDLDGIGLPFRRFLSKAGRLHGDVADICQPAALAFRFRAYRFQDVRAPPGLLGKEDQAGAVVPFLRNGHTLKQDEFVGNLDHDAGSVAGLSVGAFSAAVAHVLQDGQGVCNELVRLVSPDVYDHSYPTGIVFRCRVV